MGSTTTRTDRAGSGHADGSLCILESEPSAEGESLARMRTEILAGLSARPRRIPSKYLYDAKGGEIFRQITDLPEYYLTRCEREILHAHKRRIVAELADGPWTIVDLGAGDGSKTQILLEQCHHSGLDVTYAPIDVSKDDLATVANNVRRLLPWLRIQAVVAEYQTGLTLLQRVRRRRALLVVFLGSSIGNLSSSEAREFLQTAAAILRPGDQVLVGFDLLKDVELLQRAYDDPLGVTANFNLNLLRRLNRELNANFDPTTFRHYARFEPRSGAMESFLLSNQRQTVCVSEQFFEFEPWEAIHTETSGKYRESDISALGRSAGLTEVGRFYDERHWFADVLWRKE